MAQTASLGFWQGGKKNYIIVLQKEENRKGEELHSSLSKEVDPAKKAMIEEQIKEVQTEYSHKRKAADSNLY